MIQIVTACNQMGAMIAGVGEVDNPITRELLLQGEVPLLGHGRLLIRLIVADGLSQERVWTQERGLAAGWGASGDPDSR